MRVDPAAECLGRRACRYSRRALGTRNGGEVLDPDWHDPDQKALACLVRGTTGPDLYLMFNAGTTPVAFVVPDARPTGAWRVAINTARPSASGAGEPGPDHLVNGMPYALAARSSAVLVSDASP